MTHFMDIIILNLCNWCRQLKIYVPIFSHVHFSTVPLAAMLDLVQAEMKNYTTGGRKTNVSLHPFIIFIY